MICNSNARNNGKLLAAIVAMLMVVCAVAVAAMPSSDAYTPVNGGTLGSTEVQIDHASDLMGKAEKGVIKIDDATTITLNDNIGSAEEPVDVAFILNADLTIKSAEGKNCSIYIKSTKTTVTAGDYNYSSVIYFNADNLSFNVENASVYLDNASQNLLTKAIFNSQYGTTGGFNATVSITNGDLILSQTGTVAAGGSGSAWIAAGEGKESHLKLSNGDLICNGTAAFQDTVITTTGTANTITMNDVEVGLVAADGSDMDNLTYTVNGANVQGLAFKGTVEVTNTTFDINDANQKNNASRAGVMLYGGSIVNMDKASTIAADSMKVAGSNWNGDLDETEDKNLTMPVVNGGTIEGASFMASTGDGDIPPAKYTLNGTTLDGSSAVNAGVTVIADSEGITVDGNLRNNGTMVTIEGGVEVDGRFTNNGTVNGAKPITGSGQVTNNGTMNAPVESSNYTNNNTSDLTVYGDSTGTQWYPARQNITVPEGQTWTIISGNIIVIPGTLNVLGNLVIEEGGVLIIGGVGNSDQTRNGVGNAVVEGTLTVEEGGKLIVAYGNVDINGTASIDGEVMVGFYTSDITAENPSYVVSNVMANINVNSDTAFSEYSTVSQGTKNANIAVATDVVLTLEGRFGSAVTIGNSGSVVIDSEPVDSANNNSTVTCGYAITVNMLADGASVDIVNLAVTNGGKVVIDDANLVTGRDGKTVSDLGNYNNRLSFTSGSANANGTSVISGLRVVENFDGLKMNGETLVDVLNTMDISGDVSAGGVDAQTADINAFIYLYAGDFTVSDDGDAAALSLGENVTLYNNAALTVSGYVPVNEKAVFTNVGETTLAGNGHIYMAEQAINGGTLNAAFYETTENAVDYSNYVTVDTAIAAANANTAIDEIVLYGKNTATVSATVPAIDFTFKDATLNIGTTNSRDVVLTITAGASYNGTGTTDVKGTLYFNDRTNLKMDESTIDADVVSKQVDADGKEVRNGWAKYTNIYTAMDEAVAGDVINVFQNAKVELDRDFTVKEGVTLVVNDEGAQIVVKNGVTLTVAGTLQSEASAEGIIAQTKFATKAANDQVNKNYASAIVVTGTLKAVETVDYGTADGKTLATSKISGAYYTDGEYNYVTPLSVAVSESMLPTIESDITVYGTVSEGDTVFNATDMCGTITVAADAKLTLSSLTLGNEAVFDVNASGLFTGTVTVGDASIAAVNIKGASIDSANGLTLGDVDVTNTNKDGKLDASLNVAAGTVVLDGTVTGNMTVDAGATLTVPSAASSDKKGVVVGNLAVDGAVTIGNGQALDVLNNTNTPTAEGNLYVDGTVTVSAATDTASAGGLTAARMYVGLSDKFATTGTGTVTGDVAVDLIYAVNGASVDAATTKGMSTTAYYVEGTVWINAYANGDKDLIVDEMKNAPVENAYFDNVWQNEAGTTKYSDAADTDNGIKTSTIGTPAAVYAVIEYDIYVINLRADQNAVSSISIDGNIMQFGMIQTPNTDGTTGYYYGYTATVSAGSHTISYQLANGYSGNGVLTVNGTQQSGLTFTTEGNPTTGSTVTYNLQLTGFEKSGYVPDSPDTPSTPTDSGDDGMTITDYLLIVLVVLIIVMAIIVAMRLMRS